MSADVELRDAPETDDQQQASGLDRLALLCAGIVARHLDEQAASGVEWQQTTATAA